MAFSLVTWWSSFMWLTMYFFEENILLQSVHCHAACPADSLFPADPPDFTVSRILTVSAGTRTAGCEPKNKRRAIVFTFGLFSGLLEILSWGSFPARACGFCSHGFPKSFLTSTLFGRKGKSKLWRSLCSALTRGGKTPCACWRQWTDTGHRWKPSFQSRALCSKRSPLPLQQSSLQSNSLKEIHILFLL